jgi:hypothetical protein
MNITWRKITLGPTDVAPELPGPGVPDAYDSEPAGFRILCSTDGYPRLYAQVAGLSEQAALVFDGLLANGVPMTYTGRYATMADAMADAVRQAEGGLGPQETPDA